MALSALGLADPAVLRDAESLSKDIWGEQQNRDLLNREPESESEEERPGPPKDMVCFLGPHSGGRGGDAHSFLGYPICFGAPSLCLTKRARCVAP